LREPDFQIDKLTLKFGPLYLSSGGDIMESILSLIISLVIIVIALKIILKVTGCLIRLVIFGAALYLILAVLNYGFNIFSFIF
jgi:Co/Zn/Cd efflux system component